MRSIALVVVAACAAPTPPPTPEPVSPAAAVVLVGLADDGLVDISACCAATAVDIEAAGFASSVAGGTDPVVGWAPSGTRTIVPLATPLAIAYEGASATIAVPAAFDIEAPAAGAAVPSTTPLVVTWTPSGQADTTRVYADYDCVSPSRSGLNAYVGAVQGDPGTLELALGDYAGCSMTLHVIHQALVTSAQQELQLDARQVRDVRVTVTP